MEPGGWQRKVGSRLFCRSTGMRFASLVFLMCAVSAGAYSIVFVDGRRVETPTQFEVLKHTLTYQVSPDIQVTPHLKTLDISAPSAGCDYGHVRQAFVARLDGLVGRRAVLRARWRDLEEEACSAGRCRPCIRKRNAKHENRLGDDHRFGDPCSIEHGVKDLLRLFHAVWRSAK